MTKPTLSDPITLRIPEDVLADIETIAQATERSRSWVIVRALRTYLQQEGAEILAYRRGLDEVASGEVEDLDEVVKDLKRIASDKVADARRPFEIGGKLASNGNALPAAAKPRRSTKRHRAHLGCEARPGGSSRSRPGCPKPTRSRRRTFVIGDYLLDYLIEADRIVIVTIRMDACALRICA